MVFNVLSLFTFHLRLVLFSSLLSLPYSQSAKKKNIEYATLSCTISECLLWQVFGLFMVCCSLCAWMHPAQKVVRSLEKKAKCTIELRPVGGNKRAAFQKVKGRMPSSTPELPLLTERPSHKGDPRRVLLTSSKAKWHVCGCSKPRTDVVSTDNSRRRVMRAQECSFGKKEEEEKEQHCIRWNT